MGEALRVRDREFDLKEDISPLEPCVRVQLGEAGGEGEDDIICPQT